ncbi:hypothetical protein [Paraburkholderia azotifigens]|nr:hypothetical protein [Paraburkholderia azotifigens]
MYKGTRHSGRTWGYKAGSISTSSFSTDGECRAIVAKCKQTFTDLGLLREADFDELRSRVAFDATKAVGARIGRGKELLASIGVPQPIIFAVPNYLLVAPKLGALLSLMRRAETGRLPVELRDLQKHLKNNGALLDARAPGAVHATPKALFHVAKDGSRTAFTPTSSFQAERLKRQSGGNQPPRAATIATAPPKPEETPAPVDTIFRCDLKPTPAQKSLLDTLFSGPTLLRSLLLKAERKPQSRHDASMFLLQHHKELQPYLVAGHRGDAVDLLKSLVIQWASRIPERIELKFSGDCALSDSNKVILPIPRLGAVTVRNESRLIEARHHSQYKPAFALAHSTHGYLIEIIFHRPFTGAPAPAAVRAREPEKRVRREPPHKRPAEERLEFGKFVSLFSALDQLRENEARIGRQFVKPDLAALEGRAVQGGLPTLGKRRK